MKMNLVICLSFSMPTNIDNYSAFFAGIECLHDFLTICLQMCFKQPAGK